jgi:hypothetical protein
MAGWHKGCNSTRQMRRVLQSVMTATLVLMLTGVPLSATASPASSDDAGCAQPAPHCDEAALDCACCVSNTNGAPAPLLPIADRTSSVSKSAVDAAVYAASTAATSLTSLARDLFALSTQRAGPGRPLSLLHSSLRF